MIEGIVCIVNLPTVTPNIVGVDAVLGQEQIPNVITDRQYERPLLAHIIVISIINMMRTLVFLLSCQQSAVV